MISVEKLGGFWFFVLIYKSTKVSCEEPFKISKKKHLKTLTTKKTIF